MEGVGIGSSIREGNNIAHGRDVVTDICLLKNGLITYHQTFKYLYGLDWRTASELIGHPHIVSIMNHRATILHDHPGWNRQEEFDELITWTRTADDDDLAKFATDETGWMWAKRKFFLVMGGKP
ncbi:unnamed protein product [Tuber aestivum]|uniref:Uncharacterized protein n=1 Tax=Tuber aestivum TaxID=59557 RepID=A0A292Q349_9PEZI|nr:unnamed protein product [Tuber aestivum]